MRNFLTMIFLSLTLISLSGNAANVKATNIVAISDQTKETRAVYLTLWENDRVADLWDYYYYNDPDRGLVHVSADEGSAQVDSKFSVDNDNDVVISALLFKAMLQKGSFECGGARFQIACANHDRNIVRNIVADDLRTIFVGQITGVRCFRNRNKSPERPYDWYVNQEWPAHHNPTEVFYITKVNNE